MASSTGGMQSCIPILCSDERCAHGQAVRVSCRIMCVACSMALPTRGYSSQANVRLGVRISTYFHTSLVQASTSGEAPWSKDFTASTFPSRELSKTCFSIRKEADADGYLQSTKVPEVVGSMISPPCIHLHAHESMAGSSCFIPSIPHPPPGPVTSHCVNAEHRP